MKKVDTTGLKCPEPLIMTRKALKEVASGESFIVITDNETSLSNLKRFLADNRTEFTVTSKGRVHTLTVKRSNAGTEYTEPAEYCEVNTGEAASSGRSYIVIFSSERMGEGDDDLGLMLTKSFVTTLLESDNKPSHILFYNSGVKLAMDGSLVVEGLLELEKSGVRLLLCGTCVNFYNIRKEIRLGVISNMYEMSEVMLGSDKIIKP